jgi:hypothetical protein
VINEYHVVEMIDEKCLFIGRRVDVEGMLCLNRQTLRKVLRYEKQWRSGHGR